MSSDVRRYSRSKEISRGRTVRLKEQLREAESGRFQIYSVDSQGRKEDHTPEHIASLKRAIAEYDQILS